MTDPVPPAWVSTRDGRLVPFDADRISRSLFAAAEAQGRPDALLARELADSVVYFLAQESAGETSSTEQIAEVVVKVVRELGHPALAAAFARHVEAPPEPGYTLPAVYTRDLCAAAEAGLLVLSDGDTPGELAGCVLEVPRGGDLAEALQAARRHVGQYVALDGLEHLDQAPARLAEAVGQALTQTGLRGVVNLNAADPPSWADPLAEGPLFADQPGRLDQGKREGRADDLLDAFTDLDHPLLRVDWHLGEKDFAPGRVDRLVRVVRRARAGAIGFVFDRPRRAVALAEGLDRRHRAALLHVGLALPVLARQPGLLADADRFCQTLGSLARLALSAAVQKRDFLRQEARAEVRRGFLLERARLVVVPVGLDEVARLYTDWGLANGGAALELGRRIVLRLREVLHQDGRRAQLETCLDGPFALTLGEAEPERANVAGLTPWDDTATPRSQLRAAAALHALAEHGTQALFPPTEEPWGDSEVAAWLEQAWRQTEVVRVRLMGVR